ncbi:MAG: VanZ family protein [Patescibacteria group bacterium]|uniref:VanZ family protein n=1 Tax=candidate division WWE3 bacterium TaxID=2053526 RepID=A0A955EBP5_UNCKA|nr:VanZ family protein [candidate division WWE3 bacterium]
METSQIRLLKTWLPAILLMALIFVFSSLPGATVSANGDVDYLSHKLVHVFLYAVLCLSLYRATKNIVLAMVLTILYGITDEYHQTFVPTRMGSYKDVIADTLGALITGILLWKYYLKLPKQLKNWLAE